MSVGVRRHPILDARWLRIAEPERPPSHVPLLSKYDAESGRAPCLRCGRMVGSHAWASQPCPGEGAS